MSIIQATFDWAGEHYARIFADWLHIHFLIRTVLLLLILWLIIFAMAKLFQYAIGPVAVLFYRHVILRGWNYLVIESLQEWLYIKYYSKDKPNFENLYLQLCDKVKYNRQRIAYTSYAGILHRGLVRRVALTGMGVFGTLAVLWVVPFGIHMAYYEPAMLMVDMVDEPSEGSDEPTMEIVEAPQHMFHYVTGAWTADSILTLTENGRQGTRLFNGPGDTQYVVVEILWDYDQMLYLNAAVPDGAGLFWLHVETPSGARGYVNSRYVN